MLKFFQNILTKYKSHRNDQLMTSIYTGNQAVMNRFGRDIYLSDLVNNCINRIAKEAGKIKIVSVVDTGDKVQPQNDDISRLFRFQPNPLQTTKDFLESLEWLKLKTRHCWIFPEWTEIYDTKGVAHRYYTAIYPLNPASVEMGPIEGTNDWYVKFWWHDGTTDTVPLTDLIHLCWRRGTNTILCGGDDLGMADDRDTLQTLSVLDTAKQGVAKSITNALLVRGVLINKTAISQRELQKSMENFEDRIHVSKSGVIAMDLTGEYVPIDNAVPVIPETTLNFLKSDVREKYGISEAVLSGDYNGDQQDAFYQSCIEETIVEIEQAFSAALFTPREQDVGHRVRCYYNQLSHLSTNGKIELAKIAHDTGVLTLNQVGAMFGMPPFEGGDRRLQSLNYVNMDKADEYQLYLNSKKKGDTGDAQPKEKN